MGTDIYSAGVNATNGYAADANDFNNAQKFIQARLFDSLLDKLAPNAHLAGSTGPNQDFDVAPNGVPDLTIGPYAIALRGGAAFPTAGSANNKVKITAGTLMQRIGASNGTEAQLLSFTFGGSDEVVIANGDPTNPRVDLIQMQLAYTDDTPTSRNFEDPVTRAKSSTPTINLNHRVTCTLSVKQGTPAASPVYPMPDAGFVALAGVVVGAAYTAAAPIVLGADTAGAVAVLHDQRMPLGTRGYTVMPGELMASPASAWSFSDDYKSQLVHASGGASGQATAVCRGAGVGRLFGIRYTGNVGSGLASSSIAVGTLQLAVANSNASGGAFSTTYKTITTDLATLQAQHAPFVGPVVQQAPGSTLGPPMWSNGARCIIPDGALGTVNPPFRALCFDVTANAGSTTTLSLGPVTFFVAEGL